MRRAGESTRKANRLLLQNGRQSSPFHRACVLRFARAKPPSENAGGSRASVPEVISKLKRERDPSGSGAVVGAFADGGDASKTVCRADEETLPITCHGDKLFKAC